MSAVPTAAELIDRLGLAPHMEGGWYRRTMQACNPSLTDTPGGPRCSMTSIHYLLTRDQPIGGFHCNRSDIAHFFHAGDALTYHLLDVAGTHTSKRLGPPAAVDATVNATFQLYVAGGTWKATELDPQGQAGYALISEVVVPGFDWADMTLGARDALVRQFPQHTALIERFTAPT